MERQNSSNFSELRVNQGQITRDIDDIRQRLEARQHLEALQRPSPTPTSNTKPSALGQGIRQEIREEVSQLLASMKISLQQTMEQQDKRLLEKLSILAKNPPSTSQ